MAENKDKLIQLLSQDPGLYDVINSNQHIYVLQILEKDSQEFQNIKKELPKDININKDIILYNILDTLIQKNLIKKIQVNKSQIYYITEKGKFLFKLYTDAKKEYNL
ncbi:MAG: hypothetical protein PHU47_01670 [Candidatus ainarchaeum sp.]|jgi:predicted transcriptional regulator|nr:hypothetical protein [Candidatus ainarchaeum sp.]